MKKKVRNNLLRNLVCRKTFQGLSDVSSGVDIYNEESYTNTLKSDDNTDKCMLYQLEYKFKKNKNKDDDNLRTSHSQHKGKFHII